jgi:hypothetical protein
MSRKDLPEVRPLSTEELDQIRGGENEAVVLRAMGWKSYTNDCLNGDGSSGTSTVWVKGNIIVPVNGGRCT